MSEKGNGGIIRGKRTMEFITIITAIFFYFFFLWSFRLVILVLIGLLLGKAKKQATGKIEEMMKGVNKE